MYTYRVLNKKEVDISSNGIKAKAQLGSDCSIIDALMQVSRHIQTGTGKESAWISTSTSLTKVLEHYAIPYEVGEKRTSVAVINNCSETCKGVNIFDSIGEQKVVINLSNNNELVNAMSNFLFCLSDGTFYVPRNAIRNIRDDLVVGERLTFTDHRYPGITINIEVTKDIKATPGIKYSRRSEEVIVLNSIPASDIVKVLNPLEIDIAYAIAKYHELKNKPFDIEEFISNNITNRNGVIVNNGVEYKLYYDMYINGLFTCDIVKKIFEKNNSDKSIDILEIYAYVKKIKRDIINNYLLNMGYNLDYIPLIEDCTHIIRMGKVNDKIKRNISMYNYDIVLSNIGFNASAIINPNVRKTFPYTFAYQENGELYALGTSDGVDSITDEMDKKIELDKVKILGNTIII